MGATNRSATAYVLESTPGQTPASPAFSGLRVTSSGLRYEPKMVVSEEIRPDRQITDYILVDADATGDIGIELSAAAFDDMIEAALQGTWSSGASIINNALDAPISDVSATVITVTAGGTNFKTGQLVLTTGFSTSANNNVIARVVSSTGTTITFPAATYTVEPQPIPIGARIRSVGFAGASGDLVATITGGNAITSTALDFTTLGLSVGQWVHIGGDTTANQFATAADNSWARISAITATRLSFDIVPVGWAADSGTGKTVQLFAGDFLTNGTIQRNFSIERQQQDLTPVAYEVFRGMQVNTLALKLTAGAIITGTLGYIGRQVSVATTRTAGATDIAPPAFSVLNTSSNIGRLAEGGVLVTGPSYFMEFNLDLNNNLAAQKAIGTLGSVGIRDGEMSLSGTVKAYFGDITLLNKVLNNTQTSFYALAVRPDGNREGMSFDVPALKLTGAAPIPGKNQDRFLDGNYQAFRHATLGYTMGVQRFFYLPIANT